MPAKLRILVACPVESGSGIVSRALADYLGVPLADFCGVGPAELAREIERRDGPYVLRAHLDASGPEMEVTGKRGVRIVHMWRNPGDTVVALDERIARGQPGWQVPYVKHREAYLALPPQHRYAFLIDQAMPGLTAFHLSWRDTPRGFPIVRGRYEHLAADPQGFFEKLLEALEVRPDHRRLERTLDRVLEGTRLSQDVPGRSKGLLSDLNQRRADDFLLRHVEDTADLWADLPWRSAGRPASGSILRALAGQPYNARVGVMEPAFPGLRFRVETDGFWVHLPGALIAPSEGRTSRVRMAVRGDAGPVFRLIGENFREEALRRPGNGPAAVDFHLDARQAHLQEFRLECFNGSKRRGVGEILECVKIEA